MASSNPFSSQPVIGQAAEVRDSSPTSSAQNPAPATGNNKGARPPSAPVTAARVGADYCRGVRITWNAILKALGTTKLVTILAVLLPMVFLILVLAVTSSPITINSTFSSLYAVKALVSGPMAVIATFSFVFGLVGIFAVWQGMQNLLGISSWVYRVIGHWAMACVTLLLFSGYAVWDATVVSAIISYVAPTAFIWLIPAGIMDAHRQIITDRIDAARHGLQASMDSDDVEAAAAAPPPPATAAVAAGRRKA